MYRERYSCLLLLVLTLGLSLPPLAAEAADLNLNGGALTLPEGELAYDIINLSNSAVLTLTGKTRLSCKQLKIHSFASILLTGDTTIVVTHGLEDPPPAGYAMDLGGGETGIGSISFNRAARAVDGNHGAEGSVDGAPGGNGTDGSAGLDSPSLALMVHGDMYIYKGSYILLDGQDGGHGGWAGDGAHGAAAQCGEAMGGGGGNGGNGGRGGAGGRGGNLSITVTGRIMAPDEGGGVYWTARGGRGGDGGAGGTAGGGGLGFTGTYSDDPGCCVLGKHPDYDWCCTNAGPSGYAGYAGSPGRGGNGGEITITAAAVENVDAPGEWYLNAKGGDGGAGGKGGRGGQDPGPRAPGLGLEPFCAGGTTTPPQLGTEGGAGGDGGGVSISLACALDPHAEFGVGAVGGQGGPGGEAGYTPWCWYSYSVIENGLDAQANVNGKGGDAGTVTIDAGAVDNLIFHSEGGDGGQGGAGGEMYTCWNSGRAGDGGTGGTGGGGGAVSLTAATIGTSIVTELTGGAGGAGGAAGDWSGEGSFEPPHDTCSDGAQGSPGSSGGSGSYATAPRDPAGFAARLTVNKTRALAGEKLDYFVSVMAATPQTSVVVNLPIPADTVFVSASGDYSVMGGVVSWSVASLPSCGTLGFDVQLQIGDGVASGVVITNQATAVSAAGPADPSATVSTTIYTEVEPVRLETRLGWWEAARQDGPDPVNTSIGSYYFFKELLSMPGKTSDFSLSVTYNSADNAYDGPLGFGWTHSYNAFLSVDGGTGEIDIKWGDGHHEYFSDQGGGLYAPVETNTGVTLTDGTPDGWLATLPDGREFTFNSSGELTLITDRQGNTTSLSHSGGLLQSVTDQCGRVVTFTYGGGRLTGISAPASITLGFTQDGNGDLTRITDPRGNHWDFTYDAEHRVLTQADRRGNTVLTQTYHPGGRVATQTDSAGKVTSYAYDDAANKATVTPPSGNAVQHWKDVAYNQTRVADAAGGQASFSFDNKGRRLSATDKGGGAVSFSYDASGNLTGMTNRAGASASAAYNAFGKATSITDPRGVSTALAYDASGNLLSVTDADSNSYVMTYNAAGQMTGRTDRRGKSWAFAYGVNGLLETTTDPLSNQASYSYDAAGRLTGITLPGPSTLSRSYDPAGNLTSTTDPNGVVTTFQHNENGQVVQRTVDPTGLNAVTTYTYNNQNRLASMTGAEGGTTTFTYDDDGNLLTETDPDGVVLTYVHDARNRLTAVRDGSMNTTQFSYDAKGNLTGLTDPLGNVWSYQYDAENRLTRATDPLGNQTTRAYDAMGWTTAITDAMGRTTSLAYDDLGRVSSVTYPGGGLVQNQHDAEGNLTRVTGPMGGVWRMTYDDLGRQASRTDPLGGIHSYTYDDLGRLSRHTDALGNQIDYTYDNGGRLTALTLPGPSTVDYQYDSLGNLTRVTRGGVVLTYTYDKAGRRTGLTLQDGAKLPVTMSFTYTPAGRPATVTYPGGRVLTYSHDTLGRLASLTDWESNVTGFTYDAAGRVVREDLPNGTYTLYAYDGANRVTQLLHQKSGGAVIRSYAFTYDAMGRVTRADATGEPAAAPATSTSTLTYNAADRPVSLTESGQTTTSLTYDANGALTGKIKGTVTATFTRDKRNQLLDVQAGGVTTTYAYDGLGNRINKTHAGQSENYLAEGRTTWCSHDDSGGMSRFYIHAGALLYSLDPAGGIRVYHPDALGSVASITDASENEVGSALYDPYGRPAGGSPLAGEAVGYVGVFGVRMDENGLYHMSRRYYDPSLGSFISPDPLGLAQDLNLYRYAGGDPVNAIDPSGLRPAFRPQRTPYRMLEKSGERVFTPVKYGVDSKGVTYVFNTQAEAEAAGSTWLNRPARVFSPKRPAVPSFGYNAGYDGPVTPGKEIAVYEGQTTALATYEQQTTALATVEQQSTALVKPTTHTTAMVKAPNPSVNPLAPTSAVTEAYAYSKVDKITFFFKQIGVAAENFLARGLGQTGAQYFIAGAGKVFFVANLVWAGYEGWNFGRTMSGEWIFYDTFSGEYMTMDEFYTKLFNDLLNENPDDAPTYNDHRLKYKLELQEFKDEMQRVWDMK